MAGKIGNRGNPNATGRPSVKETIWHKDKWELDTLVNELEQKVASGKYAIRDIWLLKALKGNDKILRQAADKILANLVDLRGKDGDTLQVPHLVAVLKELEDED